VDSAFFTYDALAPVLTHNACFSVTARMNPTVTAALSRITESAWTAIRYPQAVWDDDEQRWISDAEVAEIPFTAFTSRRKAEHLTGRLVVRRVERLQPRPSQPGNGRQSELFTAYRYHAFFTNSPGDVVTADLTQRAHAIVEQVIADLKNGPLTHLPSGVSNANAAWLTLAAIAFNLTTRRRLPRRSAARPSDHRHAARPTDERPGAAGPLRPTPPAAPATRWPWRIGWTAPVHRRDRTTDHLDVLTTGHQPRPSPTVEEPDRPAAHPRPPPTSRSSSRPRVSAQASPVPRCPGTTKVNENGTHSGCTGGVFKDKGLQVRPPNRRRRSP
jgi:hypothetical protein